MDKKSREIVMAKLYFKNKDYKMAEKSFNEYLSMNPEDVAALKLLAQVYEQNKRFDKAFKMYERCYLAEPDRTGVLLDICRILLMNEIWLEHVDYRKWLNLAIKAFPSNPIVVNFKAFLSTLPPDDQTSPQREVPSKKNYKTPGEDPLTKILDILSTIEKRLDRLSTMEERLENIEDKISNLKINQSCEEQLSLLTKSKGNQPEPKIVSPSNLINKPFALNNPDKTPETKVEMLANLNANLFSFNKQVSTPDVKSSDPPVNLSTNLFGESMKKLNLPTENSWTTSGNNSFNIFKPVERDDQKLAPANLSFSPSVANPNHKDSTPDKKLESSPFSLTTNLFAESMNKLNLPTEVPPVTNTFSFSSNLFEDSIKKLNIPTGGVWTSTNNTMFNFSKPKDNDNDNDEAEAEGEEVVQNEELAIENTCDMEPIEIKSGEEDEDLLFEHRCKLFRFRDKEYKERGLGSIKVLKHKHTGKGRLIMRREAVGLVCLNCWDCTKVERVRDTQVRWVGLDASDGEPEPTVFLAKFKTQDLTDTFMSHLTALFSEETSSTNTSVSSPQPKADNVKNNTNSAVEKPDVELIDPKLDQSLVDKARKLHLPDLFYHTLKNQKPCGGCDGCENDD